MTLQTSSLRVAGQQSDTEDFLHSFSKSPWRSLPGSGLSSTCLKSMYEDSEFIKTWIDTIYYADKSVFQLDDSQIVDAFAFSLHTFNRGAPSPVAEDFDSDSSASFRFDTLARVSEHLVPISDGDDESDSVSTPSDDEAQYLSIPSDSPWYRQSSPSPEPIMDQEFHTGTYPNSCSNDVRQVISQQEHLLVIFHEELRRIILHCAGAEYNSAWLQDVDANLVLAPIETYEDLCWKAVVSERSPTRRLTRPLPDVPVGFGDVHGAF
ncbi:hypothetical protein PAXRUDRAFT_826057 [Paxillus rubicundulus Ve08.2h10]|uniref:Uncharacterized protein n=1 Tax=Paxillus rubicundulus Ve08.2h10 TaxID=930991 RepID=A0A0D0EA44_9AGAM|nr:hypothetical protein PAXRUDRAFT_826057 [Paxillus rubicundulus Ve08.2h10]